MKQAGLISGVCRYCADIYKATETVTQAGLPFLDESDGHPGFARLVADDYTPLVI